MTTRRCSECGQSKDRAAFGFANKDACLECRDKRRPKTTVYRSVSAETNRRRNLWKLYRITPEQYDDLRERQGRRCAICGIHEDDIKSRARTGRPRHDGTRTEANRLVVDHCHEQDAVRGLLCPDCNTALGGFKDSPATLLAAAEYVARDPVIQIVRHRPPPHVQEALDL